MIYLITTSETYRVDTETAAKALIEEASHDNHFTLAKYNCQYKEKKVKGEVEDSWYRVTLVKVFNDEKEPVDGVTVSYGENTNDF